MFFFSLGLNVRFAMARSYYCESAESIYKEIIAEIEADQVASDFSDSDGRLADFYIAYNERYPNSESQDDPVISDHDVDPVDVVDDNDDPAAAFNLDADSD